MSYHDEPFDPTRPALVLLYGETSRKFRALDRDALIVGRARGCDLGLDAPDISSLHCVITRGQTGFQIRDCGSRAGTKVNGDAVREAALHDGDLLQVGPFCFRVHLPPAPQAVVVALTENRSEHWRHSRRRLAQRALNLRHRLHTLQAETGGLADQREKIDQQAAGLHVCVEEYETRARQLEDAEREVCRGRERLNEERAAWQTHATQADLEWAQRMAAAQADLDRRRQECHDHCRLEEQRLAATQAETEARVQEQSEQLAQRQGELEALAQELALPRLEPQPQPMLEAPDSLARMIVDLQHVQKESLTMQHESAKEHAHVSSRLTDQGSALSRAEEGLREQRELMTRMLAELQQIQGAMRLPHSADIEAILEENGQLRQANEQLLQAVAAHERTATEAAPTSHPALEKQVHDLRHEITLLQQLLDEKNETLEVLRSRPAPADSAGIEADSYEAELVEFRRQLETDRAKLNQEIEQLQARNKELNQATREMELEMSRERAELARERQRLERLREEMQLELERGQRVDQGMRDRLAPVQRLRDEINVKQQTPTSALKTLRGKLSDSSK